MDTSSSDGFSKTKINKPMERKTEELSEEEKEKRMKKFVKHNEKDLKVSRTTPAGTSSPITQPFSKDMFTYFLSLFGLSVFSSFQSLDLESHEVEDEEACVENPNLYDPRFFLLLFSQICSAESYVDRHLKLIEAGVLSLALASLSSKDEMMRCAGATLLSRVYSQV